MSLTTLRDHCRRMADAEHKDDCPALTAREPHWDMWAEVVKHGQISGLRWRGPKPKWTPPTCDGCNPAAERALFARIAGEIDDYRGDQLALFSAAQDGAVA